jgi:hypothetical protein
MLRRRRHYYEAKSRGDGVEYAFGVGVADIDMARRQGLRHQRTGGEGNDVVDIKPIALVDALFVRDAHVQRVHGGW